MLHTGYSNRPMLKDVNTVINFDIPPVYNTYKESAQLVNDEYGSVLTLVSPLIKGEMEILEHLQKKLLKNFARDDMFKCIPVLWTELNRLKSRVETVIATLSNKAV